MENKRQRIELGDIFNSHAEKYQSSHTLSPEQKKAFEAIRNCRTASLGGHLVCCEHCGHTLQAYNSCGNKHCPKCQFVKKAKWVDKIAGTLPPVRLFHVVFTIPDSLNKLFYINQSVAYSLLFKAAGETLLQCAKNSVFQGGQAGAVAILHTWGQTLTYHPHIHMIVPAGALSEDKMEWMHTGKKFFLPVKVLSKVFRGILCNMLESAHANSEIRLPEDVENFSVLRQRCYTKEWVVYCEKPFSSGNNLIRYLGNYTQSVAISNHRLIQHENDCVTFGYKDYKCGGIARQMTLEAHEFIRRFLQHVLPSGFTKIRYFGFMAIRDLSENLALCYDLIEKATTLPILEGLCALDVWRMITGTDPLLCPNCNHGKMVKRVKVKARVFDSS